MADLGAYKDKFGDSGQRVLEHALDESRRRDQNFVSVEHILQALTVEEPDMFNSTMRELSLDPVVVKMAIENASAAAGSNMSEKDFASGLIQLTCSNGPWSEPEHRAVKQLKQLIFLTH